MRYRGGGVGHVGAWSNPESDKEWMDVDDKAEDDELQPESANISGEDTDDEHSEEDGSEVEEEEELGPEDGEGDDDEFEDHYDSL